MWIYLFIRKYLATDYNIIQSTNNIKSIIKQMLDEGQLTQALIDAANEHEGPGENESLHEIVDKIAVFIDSDNYKLFPTTIKVTREIKDKLDALKTHPRQSYNEVLLNLLQDS